MRVTIETVFQRSTVECLTGEGETIEHMIGLVRDALMGVGYCQELVDRHIEAC